MNKLNSIFGKCLRQETVSAEETDFALTHCDSIIGDAFVMANGIILLTGSPGHSLNALNHLLRAASALGKTESASASATLLNILEFLPCETLQLFSQFISKSTTHLEVPPRINSMRALRQLSLCGNIDAINLLEAARTDSDARVRSAAETALALVRGKN